MNQTVTYLVEAAVGLVTTAAGISLWPAKARWLAAVLVLAGSVAVVHAVIRLAA